MSRKILLQRSVKRHRDVRVGTNFHDDSSRKFSSKFPLPWRRESVKNRKIETRPKERKERKHSPAIAKRLRDKMKLETSAPNLPTPILVTIHLSTSQLLAALSRNYSTTAAKKKKRKRKERKERTKRGGRGGKKMMAPGCGVKAANGTTMLSDTGFPRENGNTAMDNGRYSVSVCRNLLHRL